VPIEHHFARSIEQEFWQSESNIARSCAVKSQPDHTSSV
jgi:hypothetical protein